MLFHQNTFILVVPYLASMFSKQSIFNNTVQVFPLCFFSLLKRKSEDKIPIRSGCRAD